MNKIAQLEQYALENQIPIMQKDGIHFVMDFIQKNQYKTILEIGTAVGYSAICMASVQSNIDIDTVEIKEEHYQQAVKNVREFQLENQIHVYHQDGLEFETLKQYDFIFLDASKSQYQKMFDRFISHLNSNGAVIVDNISFHGLVDHPENTKNRNTKQLVGKIRRFRDGMLANKQYQTTYYPDTGDGILIIQKK